MNVDRIILGLVIVLAIIMLTTTNIAESAIPPTRAFWQIWSGGENVTATNSTAKVYFIEGSGITIDPDFATNTITFTSTGGNGTSNIWSITCNPGDFINFFTNSTHPNFTCGTPSGGSADYTNIAYTNKTNTFILPQNINHTLNLENPDANILGEITGDINFTGRNDNGDVVNYARIETSIGDPSAGAEGGNWKLQVQDFGGSLEDFITWDATNGWYDNFYGLRFDNRNDILLDSGASESNGLSFMRDTSTNNAIIGTITHNAKNSNSDIIPYFKIFTKIKSSTAGTEKSKITFQTQDNLVGGLSNFMVYDAPNLEFSANLFDYKAIVDDSGAFLRLIAKGTAAGQSEIQILDHDSANGVVTSFLITSSLSDTTPSHVYSIVNFYGLADNLSINFLKFDDGLSLTTSTSQKLAFHGATPTAQQIVSGSRIDIATANLLAELDSKGLIDDQTTLKTCGDGSPLEYQLSNTTWICGTDSTGGGEANTASNLGANGEGVFSSKVGVDLQFKKLLSIDNQLTIASNSTNITFDLPNGLLTAAITSINADTTAAQVFSGTANQITLDDSGAGTIVFNVGSDIVQIDQANTYTDGNIQTFTDDDIRIGDNAGGQFYTFSTGDVAANRVASFPVLTADDTFVFLATTQTLTGKTFDTEGTGNILDSTGATAGDILVNDGSEYQEFDMGAASTCLKVNAGGTNLEWGTCSTSSPNALLDGSVHSDTVAQTVSTGSLIYGDGTPAWNELVIGSQGQILTVEGGTASWQSIPQLQGHWTVDDTQTNIGTSFVNVYTATNENGDPVQADTTYAKDVKMIVIWDKVGAGTQSCQFLNVANEVIISMDVVSGINDSGWVDIPAANENEVANFRPQCKSTTAADDPVWRGGSLLIR